MIHKAVKAMRKAAIITLVVCAPMAMPGVTASNAPTTGPAVEAAALGSAKPVAALLIPARTRLIIEYRRMALV